MLFYKTKFFRCVATTVTVAMIAEILTPAVGLALTGGPNQPEFSSFEPVATTSMVNEFTGQFNYNLPVINIPGPNGVGYALSLSYHNATSVEEEASWVGLGWTLNPGAISRIKRGFPDEYKGDEVEYWNKVRDNWTATVTKRLGGEAWSRASLGVFTTQRYNNYSGFGYTTGVSLGLLGVANVSFTESDGKSSWGFSISPIGILDRLARNKNNNSDKPKGEKATWAEKLGARLSKQAMGSFPAISSSGGLFGVYTFNDFTLPVNTSSYTADTWLAAIALQGDPLPNIGIEAGVNGSYSVQKSKKKYTRHAYGYMYSGFADNDDHYGKVIMDYSLEKDAPYNKRDRFLGIPFSNADHFMVSAEGLSGSFRLHHRTPGHFRPALGKSTTEIKHVNLDIHIGIDIGVGVDLGYGEHWTSVDKWMEAKNESSNVFQFQDSYPDGEPYFFRFSEDMGGELSYAPDNKPIQASPNSSPGGGNLSIGNANSRLWSSLNEGRRSGRAAFIGYNINSRINYHPPIGCSEYINKNVDLRGYAREGKGENSSTAKRISGYVYRRGVGNDVGEFAITKENGTTYIYGLPVYSREEMEMQYGLQGISGNNIENNFIAYKYGYPSENVNYSVVGEIRKTPYTSAYLLTEILSSDYIDRTNDGPTPDDLGGYVKFDYAKKAGTYNKKNGSLSEWYRWRSPYKGLHYQENSLSDPYDDVGTVQSGYKEIYYLNSIETKTHIAEFITSPRKDGYPAELSEVNASTNRDASAADNTDNQKLHRLDRIKLYAKNSEGEKGELLSTVNFEYDHSLCPNLPNSEKDPDDPDYPNGDRLGKLTLKRVWFEYEGVHSLRISPYEFGYEYKKSTDVLFLQPVKDKYSDILDDVDRWSAADQNPPYSAFDIDRWGNYQYNGQSRHREYKPWVDQTPSSRFDPAAWQLKWIRLPSGGEIHVQYEQHDYRYVQHREAMAMVSLDRANSSGNKYYLNLEDDLGITSSEELTRLKNKIEKYFIENREYIYFKFLYALEGTFQNSIVDLDNCAAEYITGYASLKEVGKDASGVWVKIGNATGDDYTLPEQVCMDFVRTSRAGVIQNRTNCDPSRVGIPKTGANDEESVSKILYHLFSDFGDAYVKESNTCKNINYAYSYLRIPMTRAKLGGGIRVERLLMVDPGLESGEDAALYGTEYEYKTEDELSSGVAVNEPINGREENSLVGLLKKRRGKNWIESIISGNQREQYEGPIGESVMPGASIGYSRVVVKNIHKGKTGTGYSAYEFYTAKDYPFDLQYATTGNDGVKALKADMTAIKGPPLRRGSIGIPTASYSNSQIWRTQGFRFVLNSMNGKPKSIARYAENSLDPVETILYEYYEPGELLPVMSGPDADCNSGDCDIEYRSLGKEMEVVMASRSVKDIANDYGVEADFGAFLGFLFPLPFGSAQANFNRSETILNTHVTTKIIRYPAPQKRVIAMRDGITEITEYIGFDPKSGRAVLTKRYDGFHNLDIGNPGTTHDGSYYSVSLPAWRYYPFMGQIAERHSLRFGLNPSADNYTIDYRYVDGKHYLVVNTTAHSDFFILDNLRSGDLIEIKGADNRLGIYHVGNIAGNRIQLLPASYSRAYDYAERKGVSVEILKTANTNQLTTDAGWFTTYGLLPDVVQHPPR